VIAVKCISWALDTQHAEKAYNEVEPVFGHVRVRDPACWSALTELALEKAKPRRTHLLTLSGQEPALPAQSRAHSAANPFALYLATLAALNMYDGNRRKVLVGPEPAGSCNI
jgi:hypothetical protein